MRTIKFRAWDKSTKRFWDPPPLKNFIYFDLSTVPDFIGQTYIDDSNKFKERFEISQFTGLEDKNGTEIYEGDIVKTGHQGDTKGFVEFDEGMFYVNCGKSYMYFNFPEQYEVVGNTYEHPHLLKERVEE